MVGTNGNGMDTRYSWNGGSGRKHIYHSEKRRQMGKIVAGHSHSCDVATGSVELENMEAVVSNAGYAAVIAQGSAPWVDAELKPPICNGLPFAAALGTIVALGRGGVGGIAVSARNKLRNSTSGSDRVDHLP